MIVPRTSREEILAKLKKKIDSHIPILIAIAGSGLVAQMLEKAGADCVNTFSGARLRANGMGTMSMRSRPDCLPALKLWRLILTQKIQSLLRSASIG